MNENLVLPLNRMRPIIERCVDKFDPRQYAAEQGEGEMVTLKDEIAKYCGCSNSSVAVGFGSNQVLDIVFRMKLGRGMKIVTVDPTFVMYGINARRIGANVSSTKLSPFSSNEPFSLDERKIVRAGMQKGVKIVVLASPNNPTGLQYPVEQVREMIESLPDVLFLLDEAYVEYGNYSFAKYLSKYPNLMIIRTFSKAFGLANLRLGYLLCSDSDTVEQFSTEYQYPFPVAGLAISLATELLRRKLLIQEYADKTKKYRYELMNSLGRLGLDVLKNSQANFVLLKSRKAKKIARELLSRYAIALKYIPSLLSEKEFMRITVGSNEMNERLLYSLKRILAE